MARERNELDMEVEWHQLQRAHEELSKVLLAIDWKGSWGLSRLVGLYLETSRRMIREGIDPKQFHPETLSGELTHLGHVLAQVWGPALAGDPGPGRKGFLQGLFGELARVTVRWLPPKRQPGEGPLMGLVPAAEVLRHPTMSLRATDHLARPGEPPETTKARRRARRR